MMPAIAIQPGFPVAAASPPRKVSTTPDDHFSQTLHGNPKAGAQTERSAVRADKSEAQDDEGRVDKTAHPHHDKDDKIGRPASADDGRDAVDDGDAKKDGDKEDDRGRSALPLHMKAERVFGQQWPASAPATVEQSGSVTAGTVAGGANAATAAIEDARPGLSAGNAVLSAPAALPAAAPVPMPQVPADAKAGPIGAVTTAQPAGSSTTQVDKSGPQAAADPIPAVTSVTIATTAGSGSAPAAFMAKIAALHHGAGPAPAPGTTGATSAAPASQGEVQGKIVQSSASQGTGNAGADPDGRGDDGAQNKPAQNATQPLAAAKGDAGASTLPTAQMVPASGSAASFAAALAEGGRLARYATGAASAAAAGAPVAGIPVQSLRIQLRPVELGTVTANLKYSGSQLTIDIEVQTSDAQRRLSSDSSDIVKSLQSLGFQVDKVTVRQVQPQVQSQAQPQGQPTAQDGSGGRFGGQGGNSFAAPGQSQQQAGQHRQGSESGNEDASERGVGAIQQTADRHQPGRGVFI
jgi:chemotaxis protein MotD